MKERSEEAKFAVELLRRTHDWVENRQGEPMPIFAALTAALSMRFQATREEFLDGMGKTFDLVKSELERVDSENAGSVDEGAWIAGIVDHGREVAEDALVEKLIAEGKAK